MPSQRIFLGWSRPALHSAAQLLADRSCSSRLCDLSHMIVVVPGREAGRRLLELLAEAADGHLVPPRILTQGQLPEELYSPQRPFASDLVQKMVWGQALQAVPPSTLLKIARQPPAADDWQGWLRLGDLMRRQHAELAADRLNFADVAREGVRLDGFDEAARWEALSQVQIKYWALLDDLQLWDQQTARLVAIQQHECHTDLEIVTIGTVDLSKTLRAMLQQVADRVTVMIDAPADWADRFDADGCLIAERWTDSTVELQLEQLIMVEDASAQVDAVLNSLADLQGQYALEDILIGVPDDRLVPQLRRTLLSENIPTYWPVDRPLPSTGPYRLLEAAADFLEDRRTENFSALIRHPDLSLWLQKQHLADDWLTHWDNFVGGYLLPKVGWLPEDDADKSVRSSRQLLAVTQSVLQPLSSPKVRLSRTGEQVREFFLAIYGDRSVSLNDAEQMRLREVLKLLQAAFDSHSKLPPSLDLELSMVDAIRLTLPMAPGELYRTQQEPAIQLSGWLDMPLNDAPVAFVTTFNEGYVPSSVNHDLFLPNRLRSHLGIEDNARRYARDLHNLVCMVHSREVVRLIVARRDAVNEPLTPSRLLFATEEENIPGRVLSFYSHAKGRSRIRQTFGESQFRIPKPVPRLSLPDAFRVTEFRDYLASPYRYYLRHVLRLTEVSDAITELDGAAFGTLVHDVLKSFGLSDVRHATSEVEIAGFLQAELTRAITESYGPDPLAAVLIQVEQVRRRLNAFATWQAEWRQAGWRIHAVECSNENPVPFPLGGGKTAFLKGRIDRIDLHSRDNRWALFDYKTGDSGTAPDKTHRWKGEWQDLQLPLYRHLAAQLDVTGDVQLGYIVLPRDTNRVRELFGDWSPDDLAEADEVARRVIREILEEKFWVELPEPSGSLTEFDSICQTGVFGPEAIV